MHFIILMLCFLLAPINSQSLITEKMDYYGCNIYYIKGNATNVTF